MSDGNRTVGAKKVADFPLSGAETRSAACAAAGRRVPTDGYGLRGRNSAAGRRGRRRRRIPRTGPRRGHLSTLSPTGSRRRVPRDVAGEEQSERSGHGREETREQPVIQPRLADGMGKGFRAARPAAGRRGGRRPHPETQSREGQRRGREDGADHPADEPSLDACDLGAHIGNLPCARRRFPSSAHCAGPERQSLSAPRRARRELMGRDVIAALGSQTDRVRDGAGLGA